MRRVCMYVRIYVYRQNGWKIAKQIQADKQTNKTLCVQIYLTSALHTINGIVVDAK